MGCDEIHTGRTSWLSEKDLNLPSPFPNCHKKFPLQPNSQHQYYRSDVFIAVFSLPSSLLQHHTCVSSHSYFISILVLRSPPSLAPSSCLFSTSLAHSGKWSKGAVTPIIKELLKLALTGHLVATTEDAFKLLKTKNKGKGKQAATVGGCSKSLQNISRQETTFGEVIGF